MIQNAFLQAIGATSLYKVIENTIAVSDREDNMTKVKIGLCFIAYGICGIIGGHILAKFLDKFPRKLFVYAISVGFTLNIVIITWVWFVENYAFAFLPCCIMGFLEASFNATSSTILGKDYKGRLEAFS